MSYWLSRLRAQAYAMPLMKPHDSPPRQIAARPGGVPNGFRSAAWRWVLAVALIGFALTGLVSRWLHGQAQALNQLRFDQQATWVMENLNVRIERMEDHLRRLAERMSSAPSDETAVWDEYVDELSPWRNFPGLVALAYAQYPNSTDGLSRLGRWAAAGAPLPAGEWLPDDDVAWELKRLDVFEPTLRPRARHGPHGVLRISQEGWPLHLRFGKFPTNSFLRATNPWVQRPIILGIATNKVAGLQSLVLRNEIRITCRHDLLKRTDDAEWVGVTLLAPLYHSDLTRYGRLSKVVSPLAAADELCWVRWNSFLGVVGMHLHLPTLIQAARGDAPQGLSVEVFSNHPATDDHCLNQFVPSSVVTPADWKPSITRDYRWPMYGDSWTLRFATTPVFEAESNVVRAGWAAGLGLLTTGLACWGIAVQVRAREKEALAAAEIREAHQALRVVQDERERLSLDLHDGAIQTLYAIQLGLAEAARTARDLGADATQRLANSREGLDNVIAELRHHILGNRDPREASDTRGLIPVLQTLAQRVREVCPALLSLHLDPAAADVLTPAQSVQLANITREALSNAMRHGLPRQIDLRLHRVPDGVALAIRDDGAGFEAHAVRSTGHGLEFMRRRAESLGARWTLTSTPGQGTRIEVLLPSPENASSERTS
jgi:signal transduction histidine kinase